MNYAYECVGCGHLSIRHLGSGEWVKAYPGPLDRRFSCMQCECVLRTGAEMRTITRDEYVTRHASRLVKR